MHEPRKKSDLLKNALIRYGKLNYSDNGRLMMWFSCAALAKGGLLNALPAMIREMGLKCSSTNGKHLYIQMKAARELLDRLELSENDFIPPRPRSYTRLRYERDGDFICFSAVVPVSHKERQTVKWRVRLDELVTALAEGDIADVRALMPLKISFEMRNRLRRDLKAMGYETDKRQKREIEMEKLAARNQIFDLTIPSLAYCAGFIASVQAQSRKLQIKLSGPYDSLRYVSDTLGLGGTVHGNCTEPACNARLSIATMPEKLKLEQFIGVCGNDIALRHHEKRSPQVPVHEPSFMAGYLDACGYSGTGIHNRTGKPRSWVVFYGSKEMLNYIGEQLERYAGAKHVVPRPASKKNSNTKVSNIYYSNSKCVPIAKWLLEKAAFISAKNRPALERIVSTF